MGLEKILILNHYVIASKLTIEVFRNLWFQKTLLENFYLDKLIFEFINNSNAKHTKKDVYLGGKSMKFKVIKLPKIISKCVKIIFRI
jgi:hypothetical protein